MGTRPDLACPCTFRHAANRTIVLDYNSSRRGLIGVSCQRSRRGSYPGFKDPQRVDNQCTSTLSVHPLFTPRIEPTLLYKITGT